MFMYVHKNKPADLQYRIETFLHFAKIYVGKYCCKKLSATKCQLMTALSSSHTRAEVVRKPW